MLAGRSIYEYAPANVPGLPAGWEINHYVSGDYNNLSLWRVRAFLQPFKEDRPNARDDALVYSCSRYADAYLPVEHTQADFDEAMQELVWKAVQFDDTVDEYEDLGDLYPLAVNRPSRYDYFTKQLYKRRPQ